MNATIVSPPKLCINNRHLPQVKHFTLSDIILQVLQSQNKIVTSFILLVFLPILHASSHALVTWRDVLDGQLPEAPGHHGHGFELASGTSTWTVSVLSIEPVIRATAHGPMVRANKRHLHPVSEDARLSQRNFSERVQCVSKKQRQVSQIQILWRANLKVPRPCLTGRSTRQAKSF